MQKTQVWAEIDLAAYAHNLRELRRVTRPEARLMAVVKADAYGHGAAEVSRVAAAGGADGLGVARPAEAVALRESGIDLPITIFGRTPPEMAGTLAAQDLTQAVFSLEMAEALSGAAVAAGVRVAAHVKVDSGMGRLGLALDRAERELPALARLPGLELEGLFTHFAGADRSDLTDARRQLERFLDLDRRLRRQGLEIPVLHAANSAALLGLAESHLGLVRPGITTYGLYPSPEVARDRVDLRPVMALKSRVIQLREVPAGTPISYGGTWRTPRPTTIATVAIGYADGLDRRLSNQGRMLVGGRSAPIVGRVCMDLTMLDVGELGEVEVGDEVVAFGRQGGEELTVDEIAESTGTIGYEVLTRVTGRVPRVYAERRRSAPGRSAGS